MNPKKTFKSEALEIAHDLASSLHKVGAIDTEELREYDDACLLKLKEFSPEDIKALRTHFHITQKTFANYLGLSKNIISQWERGEKKPRGSSLRLLQLIERNGVGILFEKEI